MISKTRHNHLHLFRHVTTIILVTEKKGHCLRWFLVSTNNNVCYYIRKFLLIRDERPDTFYFSHFWCSDVFEICLIDLRFFSKCTNCWCRLKCQSGTTTLDIHRRAPHNWCQWNIIHKQPLIAIQDANALGFIALRNDIVILTGEANEESNDSVIMRVATIKWRRCVWWAARYFLK